MYKLFQASILPHGKLYVFVSLQVLFFKIFFFNDFLYLWNPIQNRSPLSTFSIFFRTLYTVIRFCSLLLCACVYLPSCIKLVVTYRKKSYVCIVLSQYLLLSSLALNSLIFLAWTTTASKFFQIFMLLCGKLYFGGFLLQLVLHNVFFPYSLFSLSPTQTYLHPLSFASVYTTIGSPFSCLSSRSVAFVLVSW